MSGGPFGFAAEVELLSMLERSFGFDRQFPLLRRLDATLLAHALALRCYCRYVVLFMIN